MRHILLFIFYFYITAARASADQNADIMYLQNYLSTLKSVAIDFTQEDSRGGHSSGKLIIVKPEKFLCNYYPPYPLIIVGNTSYVSVYDYEMEQLSRVGVDENMFNFLLTSNGDIASNFRVIETAEYNNELTVELYHQEMAKNTIITLDKKNNRLKSIISHEPDGNVISINITNIVQIKNVDPKLFILQNPEVYGQKPRLDQAAIETKYQVVR